MCLLRSHKKKRLVPYTTLADLFGITEVDIVYSAVRTESLYKRDTFSLEIAYVTSVMCAG